MAPAYNSDDYMMDGRASREQSVIGAEKLQEMFQLQQQDLRAILREELNERIILPESIAIQGHQRPNPGFFQWLGASRPPVQVAVFPNQQHRPGQEDLEAKHAEMSQEIKKLNLILGEKLRVIDAIEQQNTALVQEKEALNQEIEKLRRTAECELRQTRSKLSQERAHTIELKERVASLRTMLIPSTGTQVSDSDIIHQFAKLRSLILKIVKITWEKKIPSNSHLSELQLQFFEGFSAQSIPVKYTEYRMQSKIFDILDGYILSRAHYGLGESEFEFDRKLENIERYLRARVPTEHFDDISEWRLNTMKCTRHFKPSQSPVPQKVRKIIWDFFAPFPVKSKEKGKELIRQLCDDTFALSMLMRKARDHFFIDRFAGGKLSDREAQAEEYASEPGDGHNRGKIAYCLYGGLSKRTAEDPHNCITLEKAQVVIYT